MGLFNRNTSKELLITVSDKEWVESNFQCMVRIFGLPQKEQLLFNKDNFPRTFESQTIHLDNLIEDFCNQLQLDKSLFSYEIVQDIRDSVNTPYIFAERPKDFNIDYDYQENKFNITIAKNILKHPKWLITSACYEFCKARLIQFNLEFDTSEETNLFLYLVSVYFGYGVIIGQNLVDIGVSQDAMWVERWSYVAKIPVPIIAYSLAIFSRFKNDLHPIWKEHLPKGIRTEYDRAIEFIKENDSTIFDVKRGDTVLNINYLFQLSYKQYRSGAITNAISTLQKILLISDDVINRANVYNNIGYYKLRLGEYSNSIPDFKNALVLYPNYGYANDNLGFALIMIGDLILGKEYLEKAVQTNNNNEAYSYRNLALYHQKNGNFESAELNYKKAFELNKQVDLLDYYYGCFLIERGDKNIGLEYIKLSSENGDHEGIELYESIKHD